MSNLMTTLDTVIRESLTEETLDKYMAEQDALMKALEVGGPNDPHLAPYSTFTTFPLKNPYKYGPPPIAPIPVPWWSDTPRWDPLLVQPPWETWYDEYPHLCKGPPNDLPR